MWSQALPLLKAAGTLLGVATFSGVVYAVMTLGPPSSDPNFNYSTIETTPGVAPEIVQTAIVGGTPIVVPTRPAPPLVDRPTVVPGADKGGLFADGIINLPSVNRVGWLTYSNTNFGFSFLYPPSWELTENEPPPDATGPNGAPFYPRISVRVQNAKSTQGQNTKGVNCQGPDCTGPAPSLTRVSVELIEGECGVSGLLIVSDIQPISGLKGIRCVVEYPNDKSRIVAFSIPYGDREHFRIMLERGRLVSKDEQAILEGILSSVALRKGP